MLKFNQLRYWIIGGYLIPIILSIITAVVVSSSVEKVRIATQKVQYSHQIVKELSKIVFATKDMTIGARGYLLANTEQSFEFYERARNRYEQNLQRLKILIPDLEEKQELIDLIQLITELDDFYNENLFQLIKQNRLQQAVEVWKRGQGTKLAERILEKSEQIITLESEKVEQHNQQLNEALNNLVQVVWMTTGIAFILASIIGYWIISSIIKRINQEATQIAVTSKEIVTIIEAQERMTSQQAISANQTTASMEELGASSRQSAEQVSTAVAGANQVLMLTNGSQHRNVEVENNISLNLKMEQIQQQILRLSEHLGQIYSITTVVSDLANQTNMLALNASVEAVRAGENGKGFGVVATEIRKLADQSRKSAEKISTIVTDIQTAAGLTVRVTEEGARSVKNIGQAMNDVVVNLQQISLNTKQQSVAVEQVLEAMNSLNVVAKETAQGVSQAKIGVQKLNETVQNLNSLV